MNFSNKRVTVIGLGISNMPLIDYLLREGASVSARDRKEYELLSDDVKALEGKGVKLICGEGVDERSICGGGAASLPILPCIESGHEYTGNQQPCYGGTAILNPPIPNGEELRSLLYPAGHFF